jgi:DNA-binding transcriptional MocR family regulator
MPDFHNPTGLLMDDEERGRLAVEMRRARTLPIIDETMAATALDDAPAPLPFAAHAPETISVGSASKEFWSGLRIGWLRSPEPRMTSLVASRLTLDLGAPVLEQLALLHLMRRRDAVRQERRQRLLESRAALVGALAEHLPSWCYRLPAGGLSLWCELPRPVSSALAAAALDHGVRLAAGPQFAPEGGLDRFVRLPFTQPPDALRDAVGRIGEAWDALPTRAPRPSRLGDRRGTVVA